MPRSLRKSTLSRSKKTLDENSWTTDVLDNADNIHVADIHEEYSTKNSDRNEIQIAQSKEPNSGAQLSKELKNIHKRRHTLEVPNNKGKKKTNSSKMKTKLSLDYTNKNYGSFVPNCDISVDSNKGTPKVEYVTETPSVTNCKSSSTKLTPKSRQRSSFGIDQPTEQSKLSLQCSFEESDDDDHIAPTQKIDDRPLKGLTVMVDVRAKNENRSQGVSKELQALGAKVVTKYTKEVTHMIYKEGRKATLNIAEKYSLFLVSVLWVDSCKNTWSRVPESLFPAQKSESMHTPLIIGKLKRIKSLQPKTFIEDVDDSGKRKARQKKKALAEKEEKENCKYQLDDIFLQYLEKSLSPSSDEVSPFKSASIPNLGAQLSTKGESATELPTTISAAISTIPGGDIISNNSVSEQSYKSTNCEGNVSSSDSTLSKTTKKKRVSLLTNKSVRSPLTTLAEPTSTNKRSWKSEKKPLKAKEKTAKAKRSRRISVSVISEDKPKNETTSQILHGDAYEQDVIGNGLEVSSHTCTDTSRLQGPTVPVQRRKPRKSSLGKADFIGCSSSTSNDTSSSREIGSENETKYSRVKRRQSVTTKKHRRKCRETLVFTSMHVSEQQFVRTVVKTLGRFRICDQVIPTTTHLICGGKRRTFNVLLATIQGCWILSPEWVAKSFETGEWVQESDHELGDWFPSAKRNRICQMEGACSPVSCLFSDSGWMYIAENTEPSFEDLVKLITRCGGQVTNALRKAQICIGLPRSYKEGIVMLREKWILDCISNGDILPTDAYLIDSIGERRRLPSPEF